MRRTAIGLLALVMGCANRPGGGEAGPTSDGGMGRTSSTTGEASDDRPESSAAPSEDAGATIAVADVLTVDVSGSPGDYTFSVTLQSPDTGCDRYADWWEVIGEDGTLRYRRILAHSHVDEQPFTRGGGPVPVSADTRVWIRAHMQGEGTQPQGYGGQVLGGSVADGFSSVDDEIAPLHEVAPLPDGCAF